MNKNIIIAISIFMLFFGSTNAFAENNKLTFSTHDFAPFSCKDQGKVAGPFVDIINAVCQEMGIAVGYKLLPNRRSKNVLKTGEVNGNFPLGWNKGRDEWIYFTIPLMTTEYGFFVRKDNPMKYQGIKDIEGYKVGVFGPSNTSNSLAKIQKGMKEGGLSPITIDLQANATGSGMKKLVGKRFDAYYVNKDVGFYRAKQFNIKGFRYTGAQKSLFYFAGFAKEHNSKEMVDKFNKAALKLYKSGVFAKILKKYGIAPAKVDDTILKKYKIKF